MRTALTLTLLTLLAASCSGTSAHQRVHIDPTHLRRMVREGYVCTISDSAGSVDITVAAADARDVCGQLLRNLSGSDSFWVHGQARNAWEVTCKATTPTNAKIIVRDDGGNPTGTAFCGQLAHIGWTVTQ